MSLTAEPAPVLKCAAASVVSSSAAAGVLLRADVTNLVAARRYPECQGWRRGAYSSAAAGLLFMDMQQALQPTIYTSITHTYIVCFR